MPEMLSAGNPVCPGKAVVLAATSKTFEEVDVL
jgi:hypothetical protein